MSDVRFLTSDVRCLLSDVRRLMSDIGTRFLVLVGEPLVGRNLGVVIFSHSIIN